MGEGPCFVPVEGTSYGWGDDLYLPGIEQVDGSQASAQCDGGTRSAHFREPHHYPRFEGSLDGDICGVQEVC